MNKDVLSTLFVKQHVIIDVISAFIISSCCYLVSKLNFFERIKSYLKNDIIPMVKEEATDFVDNKLKPEAKNLFEKEIKPVLTSKVVDPMKKYAAKELSKIQGEVISKIEDTVNGPVKETIKSTISESLKETPSVSEIVSKTNK